MPQSQHTFTTLIVEDDSSFSEQLSHYIGQVKFLDAPHICISGMDALKILAIKPVDILFLDLNLPDMGGLDLLRAARNLPAVVITSAHSERAIDCFDYDIIDFLPKPYDFNRFLRGISRVLSRTQAVPVVDTKPVVTANKEDVYFKSGRRLERFTYTDILYLEAYGIYTKVHTSDGIIAVNKRISILAQDLPQNHFFRIHKSFIVNIAHLKRLESKQLWIKSTKLPIGVTFQPRVHAQLKKLGVNTKVN